MRSLLLAFSHFSSAMCVISPYNIVSHGSIAISKRHWSLSAFSSSDSKRYSLSAG